MVPSLDWHAEMRSTESPPRGHADLFVPVGRAKPMMSLPLKAVREKCSRPEVGCAKRPGLTDAFNAKT